MQTTRLGHSDLEVSVIGLGCMSMIGLYGAADESECIATIHEAIDSGVNFLDTSDAYGAGKNEELVGRAIKGRRDRVVLATKFGNVQVDGKPGAKGDPAYVVEACDKSLKRLGVDVIDLYYQHRVDPKVPIEETVGAMKRLMEQGKVRALGLSEAAAPNVRRAAAAAPISALQTEYSLWTRFPEDELIPICRELGITYVAYSPLGRGFLTGAVRGQGDLSENDRRRQMPRFQGGNLDHNLQILGPLGEIAKAHGCTPAQAAIAWIRSKHAHVVPIPGSKQRTHLRENAAAAEVRLTADEVARLDRAAPPDFTAGDRYPAAQMANVNI